MNSLPHITGIHHITAVASSPSENLAFYEQVLGLRLVKRTVNFDDPFTYHFYYGDGQGSPGTILTFFPWKNVPLGRPGAGMVTAMAFGAPHASMGYWQDRLASFGVETATEERFGEPVIRFNDPHGLPLEIVGVAKTPSTVHWTSGPIDRNRALFGFHSATATVNALDGIQDLLADDMGLTLLAREGDRLRFEMTPSGPGRWFDLVHDPVAHRGRPGGGTVHHIAFRVKDDDEQLQWQNLLRNRGIPVTAVRDRNYFKSIYYHTPAGILFEIATDPPGFSIDEPVERLGTALMLPAQYEPMREEISQRLPELREKTFKHIFEPAFSAPDNGRTLVPLHGTGGSERDLLAMAKKVGADMAVISPRGRVLEGEVPRFFKRLANNVLDEADIRRRVQEMAGFLSDAVLHYGRDPEQLTALGYSNGANMAASMLMLRPEIFSSAILLRPMLPLTDSAMPDLNGKTILVLRGVRDTVIPSSSTDELIHRLKRGGAAVTVRAIDAGHDITRQDVETIRLWLDRQGGQSMATHETRVEKIA